MELQLLDIQQVPSHHFIKRWILWPRSAVCSDCPWSSSTATWGHQNHDCEIQNEHKNKSHFFKCFNFLGSEPNQRSWWRCCAVLSVHSVSVFGRATSQVGACESHMLSCQAGNTMKYQKSIENLEAFKAKRLENSPTSMDWNHITAWLYFSCSCSTCCAQLPLIVASCSVTLRSCLSRSVNFCCNCCSSSPAKMAVSTVKR